MKVVQRTLHNQLVEFVDGIELRRVWMPADAELTMENARKGVDIGIRLEDIEELGLAIDARKLLSGLRRRGIWSRTDLQKPGSSKKVQSALFEGLGWAAAQLMNLYLDRR